MQTKTSIFALYICVFATFYLNSCTTLKEPKERQNIEERHIEEIVAQDMIRREAKSKVPKIFYLELSPTIQKKLISDYTSVVTLKGFNQFTRKRKGKIVDKTTGEMGAILSVWSIDFDVSNNIFLKEANLKSDQVDAVATASVYIGPLGVENYYYYLKKAGGNWIVVKTKLGASS